MAMHFNCYSDWVNLIREELYYIKDAWQCYERPANYSNLNDSDELKRFCCLFTEIQDNVGGYVRQRQYNSVDAANKYKATINKKLFEIDELIVYFKLMK